MSRIVNTPLAVVCDVDDKPVSFRWRRDSIAVLTVCHHWREWVGALDGEAERDIWRVDTAQGIAELHHLHAASLAEGEEADNSPPGQWILYRWED